MLAARLLQGESELSLDDVVAPSPESGECTVEVAACALCASDLHILDGEMAADRPLILGHEAAGIVHELGPGVTDLRVGDRVFIDPIIACGHCAACRGGRSHICQRRQIIGVNRDGALAQRVRVPATNLVPVPDALSLEHAAMVESASTVLHALTKRAPAITGDPVAVVGVGGLGFHAVALASLMGAAAVVAIDVNERALERALAHGATAVFDAREPDVGRAVRTATGGGVTLAIEAVGSLAARDTAFSCLRRGGTAVLVGVGPGALGGLAAERLVTQELEVRGAFAYSRDEIERVIRLAAAGRIDLGAAISERYPLTAVADAVASFRAKTTSPVRVLVDVD